MWECVCRRSSPHLSCFYNLSFIQENEKEVLKMKMKLFQTCRRTLVLMYPFTMFCGDTNSFSSFSRKINQNILETVCSLESILTSICWQESTEFSQKQKIIKKTTWFTVIFFFLGILGILVCISQLKRKNKKKVWKENNPFFCESQTPQTVWETKFTVSRVATLTIHLQILFY